MAEALIRVMGAALLLLGAAGAGFSGIRNIRARIGELEAALALVRHIRESIGRLTAPLSEIYASFADPRLTENGFLTLLRTRGMAEALEKTAWRMPERDLEILRDLAGRLGRGFPDEQCALCRYAEDRLEEDLDRLRKAAPGEERLWRSIPILSALSLLLLLY